MSPSIARRRESIERRLAKANADLAALQQECAPHLSATRKGGSNCGYDYEHYWWDYTCPDCGKRWRVDQ